MLGKPEVADSVAGFEDSDVMLQLQAQEFLFLQI